MRPKLVGARSPFQYGDAGVDSPMPGSNEPIRPMTLGNMRQNGVRGLDVTCQHCGHHTEVNVDRWPDNVRVPSFGPRMRCSRRGRLSATAIPNWNERRDYLPGGSRYRPRGPYESIKQGK
jgi:hypothetical protein